MPSVSGIALIAATMFSAVNSPTTPRVVFGMVISGGGGVRLLRVVGCAQSGAVGLWALGVQSWSATCSGGLFGLLCRPARAAKRAAHSSRPSGVVLPCRRLSQPDVSCAINRIIEQRTDVENNLVEVLPGVVRLALIAGVG